MEKFGNSGHCAATDANFDRRSRLQTRRTFAQQKPKRKWGLDAMCHEKRMALCICLFGDYQHKLESVKKLEIEKTKLTIVMCVRDHSSITSSKK